MKYLLPFVFVPLPKTIKFSCRQLLLVASCSLPLLGCNNQPASSINNNTNTENNSISDQAIKEEASSSTASTALEEGSSDGEISIEDKGTSLIDSAKTDDIQEKRRSPMIAEKRASSALQATLIGNYMGILPCSNCDEITLTLDLHSDGTVKQTSVYENSETARSPLVETGVYRQDNDMITIVYSKENIDSYHIQDNHLVMLDKNKNPDPDYTLSRY